MEDALKFNIYPLSKDEEKTGLALEQIDTENKDA